MDTALQVDRLVLLVCATGLAISTLEFWVIAGSFETTGVYSWRILQMGFRAPSAPAVSRLIGGLSTPLALRAFLSLRLLSIVGLFAVPLGSVAFSTSLAVLVATQLLFTVRRQLGDDGSDQMNSIILLAMLLTVGPHSDAFILQLGIWFIALQACLSYTTAGIAKLISPTWRSGEAAYRIFNTGTYGMQPVAALMQDRRWLKMAACWSVIGMETLFPLVLVLPAPWIWIFLGWGVLFHVLCAIIMGLNSFVWAFVATYPAIVFASLSAQEFIVSHFALS